MKKTLAVFLAFLFALTLASCGGGGGTKQAGESMTDANGNVIPSNIPTQALTDMKLKFDSREYTLYQNVMAQTDGKGGYDGLQFTKDGVFAVLQDDWSGKTRYYVWGYADSTMCCDYQWEFVPADVSSLPKPGSYITVAGTLKYTADQKTGAMDHYWITGASVTVQGTYTPAAYDYDLTTMSNTLAYVQISRMQDYPEKYTGKTALIYGRTLNPTTLQHPYYNEVWKLGFTSDQNPAPGTYLILGGKLEYNNKTCTLNVTDYRTVSA